MQAQPQLTVELCLCNSHTSSTVALLGYYRAAILISTSRFFSEGVSQLVSQLISQKRAVIEHAVMIKAARIN